MTDLLTLIFLGVPTSLFLGGVILVVIPFACGGYLLCILNGLTLGKTRLSTITSPNDAETPREKMKLFTIIWLIGALPVFYFYASMYFSPNAIANRAALTAARDASPVSNQRHSQTTSSQSLAELCALGDNFCTEGIKARVVRIDSSDGSGTGFIYSSDRREITILTASHVIRKGNGTDSIIQSDLFTWNGSYGVPGKIISACGFFMNAFGDIGIIKVNNSTGKIFAPIEVEYDSTSGDTVFVGDHRKIQPLISSYMVHQYLNDKSIVELDKPAYPGMSGSPIISKRGRLVGVVISTNDRHSQGTFRFDEAIRLGVDYLIEKQSVFTPYICEKLHPSRFAQVGR